MTSAEWAAMSRIVSQIRDRYDAEPFREPVDWKAMELFDYPEIIKKPMDLKQVKRKIENSKYETIHDAAQDMRLIWKNCMLYNEEWSDFYILASNLSKRFEDKYAKFCRDFKYDDAAAAAARKSKNAAGSDGPGGNGDGTISDGKKASVTSTDVCNDEEPTMKERKIFTKSLYDVSKEDLKNIISTLDDKCPSSIARDVARDELQINVEVIPAAVFYEVMDYVDKSGGGSKVRRYRGESKHEEGTSEESSSAALIPRKKKSSRRSRFAPRKRSRSA
eukprot:CAMPEP_0172504706 /NCGR_PEP_ID=MMETSP1066-20121228/180626_1 /TAXON_ID=671091 /ORGANISM="Coscinodiscus wailesii, Strain CCMP2513" /LENGTH=275 /DNA_ID=CAMNT_0013280997 /DNA_START=71 /DNA_END=898 /DNA_ORIENTATION=+